MAGQRMSICVASPDEYSDVVKTFLGAYKSFCAQLPYELVISTQTERYEGATVLHSNDKNDNWTLRMLSALNYCTTKYILLMCDDIIFTEAPEIEELEKILDCMDSRDLNFCGLTNSLPGKSLSEVPYLKRPKKTKAYAKNLQCGIFNREYLLAELGDGSLSPWDIEAKWLTEAQSAGRGHFEDIASARRDVLHCVHGIVKGKWFPSARKSLKKAGVEIYGERQVLSRKQEMKMRVVGRVGKALGAGARRRVKRMLSKLGFKFVTRD